MIVFDLACGAQGHVFEAWFGSTEDYEGQRARGLVACPLCGDTAVSKAVMAPNVAPKGNARRGPALPVARPDSAPPAPEAIKAMLSALAEAQARVLATSDDMGDRFADEARAIHFGESEKRAIHGVATPVEVKGLVEDGVEIAPLPFPTRAPGPHPLISRTRAFLRAEAAGGILLMIAAAAAMLVANGPLAPSYFALLHAPIGPMSVLHWINDGLMAAFFLLVGLEIKRECLVGRLAGWGDRLLPALAAAGGMAMPALVYIGCTGGIVGLGRGWAIPTATDIAFAIAVMALLGRRVPASLKLFLMAVAIVDDMGAVAIIAIAYTAAISLPAIVAAAMVLAAMVALNRSGVRVLWPYLLLAAGLWIAVHASGVHATIAGVLAAFTIPLRTGEADAPLPRLEHALHPWVAFGIVPLFGFANAGVALGGVSPATLLAPLPLGVAAGLFLGKQAGVFGSVWLAVRAGIAPRPAQASWTQIYGMALLCGIGFTMSLFIGGLAFADPVLLDRVKIGVLAGSILSALAGSAMIALAGSRTGAARWRDRTGGRR